MFGCLFLLLIYRPDGAYGFLNICFGYSFRYAKNFFFLKNPHFEHLRRFFSSFFHKAGFFVIILGQGLFFKLIFQIFATLLQSQVSIVMARVCQITGKKTRSGNKVSHANNKTKRTFAPNIQKKRFFLSEENRWVTLKLSAKAIKTISSKGLSAVLAKATEAGYLKTY